MAESDDVSAEEPQEAGPPSALAAATRRPAWIDAVFAATVAIAFGLSLVRTPVTAVLAAVVFLVGSVAYAVLRIVWSRRHPRPVPVSPRTADGLLYLGVLLVAYLLSGVNVDNRMAQIVYAVVAGLLIGGTALFLLRREERRRLSVSLGEDPRSH